MKEYGIFHWMAWTLPVAVFFACIVLMLIGMTLWELRSPTVERKGFLPIATSKAPAYRGASRRCGSAWLCRCCCWRWSGGAVEQSLERETAASSQAGFRR